MGSKVSSYPVRQRATAIAIQNARKKAGLTKKDLSLALGEHHTFMSRIERMQRDVSLGELEAIAKACGIAPMQLIKEAMR